MHEFTLRQWLSSQLPYHDNDGFELHALKGDASFRRYYRVKQKNITYVAAHSPPETENNAGFVHISKCFKEVGLNVPQVLSCDLQQGFFLLTDLGDKVLFESLNTCPDKIQSYYENSLNDLAKIQRLKLSLPLFDEAFMHMECHNFKQWFLKTHLEENAHFHFSKAAEKAFDKILNLLITQIAEQPFCVIHRDYHSRNLMLLEENKIGILDFQDAMWGPVTYDMVSLLKDCYVEHSPQKVQAWALKFHQNFLKNSIADEEKFMQYFEWMGIQRHLKAAFIFARKYHRDQSSGYLKDIPRTLNYVSKACENYPELNTLKSLVEDCLGALEKHPVSHDDAS